MLKGSAMELAFFAWWWDSFKKSWREPAQPRAQPISPPRGSGRRPPADAPAAGRDLLRAALAPKLVWTDAKPVVDRPGAQVRFTEVKFEEPLEARPLGVEITWTDPPYFTKVLPGRAAASAGIEAGDMLLEVNGVNVRSGSGHEQRLADRPILLRIGRLFSAEGDRLTVLPRSGVRKTHA